MFRVMVCPNILKDKLDKVKVSEEELLVSFDVVSLFTNIPIPLAINIIMSKWSTIKQSTNIAKNKFLNILNLCLKDNNYFACNEKFYIQTFGMPMGNPLSPTIADIIMDDLLNATMIELKEIYKIDIQFIVKYVDDIFAIVKRKDVDIILKTLNKYHRKLQFTIETEANFRIPFLDVMIHRRNDSLILDWYSKPTSSGRLINYLSSQPSKYKINTAKNLINKILKISHQQFHDTNIKKIFNILRSNNYPEHIIHSLVKQITTQINDKRNNPTITTTNNETKRYYSVTYVPRLSEKIDRKKYTNNQNTILAYRSNHTLSSVFTKTKTPIEPHQQNNVVYEITCEGSENEKCNKIYIGTTKRPLAVRLSEHEADIKKNKSNTALSQHISASGHTADLTKTKIIDKEKRERTRFTLESLRILQKRDKTMNKKEDTDDIATAYLLCL
ncbi:PREDICTED: uncharacterized protein LOC108373412 isoform X1 [Rhagoletis zephyria]|uniref:uncharacterized protein LOC108373412 isoform X1 n=2 Tax=Rhagoletis zephyria TaxID=28612 RepID=UPI0008116BED|nr:PREDICTED: uncharacterized protein LOC108373412 isoform X1 [Rhagoletis zephyria]